MELKTLVIFISLISMLNCDAFSIVKTSPNQNFKHAIAMFSQKDSLDGELGHVKVLAGASMIGAIETSYLTFTKLTSSPVADICTGDSCNALLSGPYATIPFLGIPLSLLGFIAYSMIAYFSINEIMNPNSDRNDTNKAVILALSSGMATFSMYLMLVLTFIIKTACPYCYLSAFLSIAMSTMAWKSDLIPNKTKSSVIVTSTSTITALGSAFLFYVTSTMYPMGAQASTAPLAQVLEAEKATNLEPPPITKVSSPKAIEVAKRLQKNNAKMYGAYWCSHCFNQKQNLGIEASKYFEYIECDKKGKNSQNSLCKSKNLPGYPTWEINGKFFPGEKTVEELSETLREAETETETIGSQQ